MATRKFDLAITIALVPVLGTGLVLMNQLGRYLYYGVPPEMLELDAYKVLISSLSMLFIGLALLYVGATFYNSAGSRAWQRMAFHLIFAVVLTAPFWYKEIDRSHPIPWLAVLFVIFTGAVMFGAERWLHREGVSTVSMNRPTQRMAAGWGRDSSGTLPELLAQFWSCSNPYNAGHLGEKGI